MKNALLIFIVIASLSSINAYADELTCESLNEFYKLWSDSWFGKDPTREKSAWMIQNSNGDLAWVRWPATRKWKKETWNRIIPANLVAQVHTHPLSTDPRPSYKDVVFSRNVETTLYSAARGSGKSFQMEQSQKWPDRTGITTFASFVVPTLAQLPY